MRDCRNGRRSILILNSSSEEQTDQLGQKLAAVLTPGLTIALSGELGSGKTRFVRALCAGLGVDTDRVNSPTFVLMQLYTDGRIPVAHFDTYRLADVEEFLAIGADEFLQSGEYLCLIEWADRVADILPDDRLSLTITQTAPLCRTFTFSAGGPRSASILSELARC